MKRLVPIALALPLAWIAVRARGPRETTATVPPPEHFHFEKKVEADLPFLKFLPRGYDEDPARRWPLVIFLHGTAERGSAPLRAATYGPARQAREGRDFPFVLVAPQCAANERWQNDVLLGLVARILETERIDTNRVYLTGLSMGGYATWYLGMKHPEVFAALAPVCGGGQVLDVRVADATLPDLRAMPVWAFHGAKDAAVPPAESEQMVEALRAIGNTAVRRTLYPDEGHECWERAYGEPEFYKWLLAQTREGRLKSAR